MKELRELLVWFVDATEAGMNSDHVLMRKNRDRARSLLAQEPEVKGRCNVCGGRGSKDTNDPSDVCDSCKGSGATPETKAEPTCPCAYCAAGMAHP